MADFLGMMKQAAELKSKMEAMQAELERMEVEGAAGGGFVTLKLSGKGEIKAAHDRQVVAQAGSDARSSKTSLSQPTPTRAASSKPSCRKACRR